MKVMIVNGNDEYVQMFIKLGFTIAKMEDTPDLICFTGGEDVNPALYGEKPHPSTYFNTTRDEQEMLVYQHALKLDIPMVGICRGGQFLHVMNGGKLYQDVDNHALYETHAAFDTVTGEEVQVTSTHHQMMKYTFGEGELVAVAHLTDSKSYVKDGVITEVRSARNTQDPEVIWHADTNCLCFQPHPEFVDADSTYLYFKNLLTRYLGEKLCLI